jgi:hypothetical protein
MGLGKDRGARFEENCLSIPMSGMQPEPQGRSILRASKNPGLNGNDCGCRSEGRKRFHQPAPELKLNPTSQLFSPLVRYAG